MPKSLSELESSSELGPVTRTKTFCLSGTLVAELEAADTAFFDVTTRLEALEKRLSENEPTGRRRVGQRSDLQQLRAEAAEKAAACDAVRARMADHEVTVLLGTIDDWRDWATKHPARDSDDNPAGARRDMVYARGACDIDALIADLPRFIRSYNDEPPSDRWWALVQRNAAPGDLTDAASIVVQLHEQQVDLGKSRSAWLGTLTGGPASE